MNGPSGTEPFQWESYLAAITYFLPNVRLVYDSVLQKFGVQYQRVVNVVDIPSSFTGSAEIETLPLADFTNNTVQLEGFSALMYIPTTTELNAKESTRARLSRIFGLTSFGLPH